MSSASVENEFENADEEQAAHAATFASQAHNALFRHIHYSGLSEASDAGNEWAYKVEEVLYDALHKMEELVHEEVAHRPDIKEAGRAWAAAFDAEHAEHRAEYEKFLAGLDGGAGTAPTAGDSGTNPN